MRCWRINRLTAALAALCLCASPLFAQDAEPDPQEIEAAEQTEELARSERAADIRDAINENLVEPLPELEVEIPEEETLPEEETPVKEEPAVEEHWYGQFKSVTESVQTLPERIPGLRGRGWIHFGRIEGEYGSFSGGALDDESGFNFRSLRGGLIRRLSEKTTLKLEIDATDGDSNWVDLWVRYRTRFGIFTVGNQRVAQTLVNQTSRLSRTFQEVPLPADAFGLGRRLGVGWDLHRKENIGGHLTVFGSDLNDNIGKFGYGARFYYNPTRKRLRMVHLGISAVREEMDRDARFRAYPETRVTDIRLVDTGRHSEVDQQTIYGIELAGARDSWSFRSEYFWADWKRSGLANPGFDGYYLQANWAITGETFNYTQGKFLRIRPNSHIGAFEVAIRHSRLDLDDLDIYGGKQKNTSLALNWYSPGNQFRLQGSVIYVDPESDTSEESSWVAQVRAQLHW